MNNTKVITTLQERVANGGKKVFYRMLELEVINSYIVYRAVHPEINGKKANRSHRSYLFVLIHQMAQVLRDARADPNNFTNSEQSRRHSNTESTRLLGKHFVESVYPK